jgi:hypothetical protein
MQQIVADADAIAHSCNNVIYIIGTDATGKE